jgi:hypothetical protein
LDAVALQRGDGAIHGVAFAKPAGVDGHILCGELQPIISEIHIPKIDFAEHRSQLSIGGHSVAFFFDKPPQIGEGTDGGVERAVGFLGHGEGALEDSSEFGIHCAAGIGAGEVAVGAMDAEQFVDRAKFIEGGSDGRLGFCRFRINGDGNKSAEVRLNAGDRLSGRPALAAA